MSGGYVMRDDAPPYTVATASLGAGYSVHYLVDSIAEGRQRIRRMIDHRPGSLWLRSRCYEEWWCISDCIREDGVVIGLFDTWTFHRILRDDPPALRIRQLAVDPVGTEIVFEEGPVFYRELEGSDDSIDGVTDSSDEGDELLPIELGQVLSADEPDSVADRLDERAKQVTLRILRRSVHGRHS